MSNLATIKKADLQSCDAARLRWRPDPFLPAACEKSLQPGVTLLEGVSQSLRANDYNVPLSVIEIWVAENEFSQLKKVPRNEWDKRLIKHGEFIQVTMPIQGGGGGSKNPMRTILMVVVAVAAIAAVSFLNPALATFMTEGMATFVSGMAGAAISVGGMLLVNQIAPPSTPKLSNQSAGTPEKVWSIDGIQNRADLYGLVPFLLGKARFAPRYAAQPYTVIKGSNQYARYLFCVAGHNRVSDIRIGDTPIENFRGVNCKVHENWQGEKLEMYSASTYQEDLNIELKGGNGWFYRTTTTDCIELQFELYFTRGLCLIDKKNRRWPVSIAFEAQYRKVGEGDNSWRSPFGAAVGLRASSTSVLDTDVAFKEKNIVPLYLDHEGQVSFAENIKQTNNGWAGYDKIGEVRKSTTSISVVPDGNLIGADLSLSLWGVNPDTGKTGNFFSVSMTPRPGATFKRNSLTVSGSTLTPFRRGFVFPLESGQYELRIRRTSANSDPNNLNLTFLDDSVWSAFRSVQDGEIIKYNGAPLSIIELEIQANEQLNGHIQELNALFESVCPVWDGEKWIEEPSNNTAAIAMLLCTSPHIHRVGVENPYEMLNLEAWQGFYKWCEEMGWTYNSIQTSQELVRQVLSNVLASARASITLSNGKLGVAWDSAEKPVAYPFGPRNSWGFKANKTFVIEQPHGLRVRFLNEQSDYQEDERIIYADGYDHTNATNIVKTEFDGVTNSDLIYKHARLRLADSIWRSETYEFNTDFAYLCVDKGDRIQVTHDTPMWGIKQTRVQDIRYADYPMYEMNRDAIVDLALQHKQEIQRGSSMQEFRDFLDSQDIEEIRQMIIRAGIKNTALMSGIVLDDIVSMESGKEYSIRCFITGRVSSTFSIMPRDASTNELTLFLPIPANQAPAQGSLAHFGYANHETHDLIVVGIDTSDELSAQIYAQDYSAEQIYAAMNGPIPPWNSDISLPSRWQLGKPGAPSITRVVTDEYVLSRLSDGTLIPRIQVTYSLGNSGDVEAQNVFVQVRQKDSEDEWREAGQAHANSNVVYADGVDEQVTYEVRIYSTSATGATSEFSTVYDAYVIGRTTPPPAPTALHIEGSRIWWEMPADYPMDVRGWEVFMGFDDTDPFDYALKISAPFTSVMEFDIERWSGWSRRVWVRTVDDAGLASRPVSAAINLGDAILDNVVVEVAENAERQWPGLITSGSIVNGHLTPSSSSSFWHGSFWTREDFWISGATDSMTYETEILVPEEAVQSYLTIQIDMPDGVLGSVEYMLSDMEAYAPMPNEVYLETRELVKLRVTTREGTPGIIREIKWVFDVEDQKETIDDILVPVGGLRLPITESFRWISNLAFGLQGYEGSAGDKVVWIDKGVIENGLVSKGPLIEVRDNTGRSVAGIVDVTIQGAKGVHNG